MAQLQGDIAKAWATTTAAAAAVSDIFAPEVARLFAEQQALRRGKTEPPKEWLEEQEYKLATELQKEDREAKEKRKVEKAKRKLEKEKRTKTKTKKTKKKTRTMIWALRRAML